MELYDTVKAGETTFLDQEIPSGFSSVIYRIDAADLDNVTPGTAVDGPNSSTSRDSRTRQLMVSRCISSS